MRWLQNMGGALGYIIGAMIVLPLIIFIYNKYFIKENDHVEPFIKPYIENVIELKFKMPNTSEMPFDKNPFISEQIETKLVRKNMTGSNSKLSYYRYQDIYSPLYKKHVRIGMVDLTTLFWNDIGDSTVMLKINKDDFNNPKYGTKEKPLMCFSLRGANGPLTAIGSGVKDSGKVYNIDTPPEQFDYNVYMYLTYVMPKEEFEERFEKKK
ncbi:hypothetical protein ACTJKC_14635 [Pedobacter sp. 22226]|uniref:hypothetical protein n=1 Tax=Pedobacter sp. 22226 TaxID=3453894 RepID=UPI003F857555